MDSGCYQLKITVNEKIALSIGRLGLCTFLPGNYIYTGSAMKNLEKRVARHQRREKALRWHIDYLLADSSVEISEIVRYPSALKEECQYNQLLLQAGAEAPIPGFGSSDCRDCPAHLLKTK